MVVNSFHVAVDSVGLLMGIVVVVVGVDFVKCLVKRCDNWRNNGFDIVKGSTI